MLAEYYKLNGEAKRADDCNKMAAEAWEAAENGVRVSAGTRGTPPFESVGTFRQNFAYTDPELEASHRWEFFEVARMLTACRRRQANPRRPRRNSASTRFSMGRSGCGNRRPRLIARCPSSC
jgi:hypothetical protein